MALTQNAKEVPNVAWEYWGIYEFMRDNPGMYGMDSKRRECHVRLARHYKLMKGCTKAVTDHMDKLEDAVQLHEELKDLCA